MFLYIVVTNKLDVTNIKSKNNKELVKIAVNNCMVNQATLLVIACWMRARQCLCLTTLLFQRKNLNVFYNYCGL